MRISFLVTLIGLVLLTSLGCESPAAEGTVTVVIENVTQRDVNSTAGRLDAVAGLSAGTCSVGPCSPNPCVNDPNGRTACIGQGDQNMCVCPAGTTFDDTALMCATDMACNGTTCNNRGMCEDDGAGTLTCTCSEGYAGTRCEQCDPTAGFFPDGFGGCANNVDICREGQGGAAFLKIIEDATAELGHAPNEIELNGIKMTVVDGTAAGVRSWKYLWTNELTAFVQTPRGFPSDAAEVAIPDEASGTPALDFEVLIDRPTFGADPQYTEGQFSVGLRGNSERAITDQFGVDIQLELEFSAY